MNISTLQRLALGLCMLALAALAWFAVDHARGSGELAGRFVEDHLLAAKILAEADESLVQARQTYSYIISGKYVPVQEPLSIIEAIAAKLPRNGHAGDAPAALSTILSTLRASLIRIEEGRTAYEYSENMPKLTEQVKAQLGEAQVLARSMEDSSAIGNRELGTYLVSALESLRQVSKGYLRMKPDRLPVFLGVMDKISADAALLATLPGMESEREAIGVLSTEIDALRSNAMRVKTGMLYDPNFAANTNSQELTTVRALWDKAAQSIQGIRARHSRSLKEQVMGHTRSIEKDNARYTAMLAGILSLAALGLLLSRRKFQGHMDTLRKAALDIAEGRFDTRIPSGKADVLAPLAESFNLMAARLEEEHSKAEAALKELQASHALLDSRVRERTRELSEALGSLEFKDSLFAHSREGFMICDDSFRIIDANPALSKMTGQPLESILGQRPDAFCHKFSRHDFLERLTKGIDAPGHFEDEAILVGKGRKPTPVRMLFTRLVAEPDGQTRYVGICMDVSEQRDTEQRLRRQQFQDSLTGLPNRNALLAEMETRLRHTGGGKSKLAVIIIGLDSFRQINMNLGHAAGDTLLKITGMRLSSSLRGNGVLARLGADEFALVAGPLESDGQALVMAKRAMSCFKEPFELSGQVHNVSASVGLAVYPPGGDAPADLLRGAGLALNRAKSQGKGLIEVFTSDLDTQSRMRSTLERDIHTALLEQHFEVHYQPILDVETSRILGAEALVRWSRNGEPVSPGVFVPICEEMNRMGELTGMVLETVTRDLNLWRELGYSPSISVNISALHFSEPDFPERVSSLLRRTGIPSELIDLEITETAILQNPDTATQVLRLLRQRGHRISIDDFGTGYSSLHYLRKFPLTALKIDRQFISELDVRESRAIVKATIAMARSIGLSVIAEGVENSMQLDLLKKHGCHSYQGYLYSPGVPADAFLRMLERDGRPRTGNAAPSLEDSTVTQGKNAIQ